MKSAVDDPMQLFLDGNYAFEIGVIIICVFLDII